MTQQTWTSSAFYRALEARLDGLMRGQVLLQDLPPAVAAWFYAGEAYGRRSRQPEITRLEREVNLLHYWLTPERERKAWIEQRLQARITEMTEDDLDRVEALLHDIAADTQIPTHQHSLRSGHTPPESGVRDDIRQPPERRQRAA